MEIGLWLIGISSAALLLTALATLAEKLNRR